MKQVSSVNLRKEAHPLKPVFNEFFISFQSFFYTQNFGYIHKHFDTTRPVFPKLRG